MNKLDILSSSPSIYFLKGKRGKNKLGGFFSLIFVLLLLALAIYYIYVFYFGLEFNLIYYRDNFYSYFSDEQKEIIKEPKSFDLLIEKDNNQAKIIPYLMDYNNNYKPAEKCPDDSDYYCFDLVFNHLNKEGNRFLLFHCEDNCTDSQGNPSQIQISIYTQNIKLNHSNDNPFQKSNLLGDSLTVATDNKQYINLMAEFTPILYRSSEILNTRENIFINKYLNNFRERITFHKGYFFFGFNLVISTNCDIYIREYRTLLDTLSKIGGLLSPLKLLFEILIMFYSDYEINSEITKNVFSKIKNYEYKLVNHIPIEKNPDDIDIKITNQNKLFRKKFNINKGEQYFCGLFDCINCVKRKRSIKILQICSDFIQTYLSAENIIFNILLFESYYNNNPIKLSSNYYLNKINMEIENKEIFGEDENEEDKKDEKDVKEELIQMKDKI